MLYQHFTANRRHTLMHFFYCTLSYRKIRCSRRTHHTSISREVTRNQQQVWMFILPISIHRDKEA
ncbi:MAG: IS30 family transposase [Candidatus Endobugula sp.]|jgi:IS30 family transposase